jgi:REP-associated tyrosine transposase
MPLAPQEIRTFFITAVTANRRPLFKVESNARLLIAILQENHSKGRLKLHGWVIMPDHIHLLLTPSQNVSLEKAVQFIKGNFSFRLQSKFPVWQPGFTSRRVKDAQDLKSHREYIHQNPVRARLCTKAEEYPYSSAKLLVTGAPQPALSEAEGSRF